MGATISRSTLSSDLKAMFYVLLYTTLNFLLTPTPLAAFLLDCSFPISQPTPLRHRARYLLAVLAAASSVISEEDYLTAFKRPIPAPKLMEYYERAFEAESLHVEACPSTEAGKCSENEEIPILLLRSRDYKMLEFLEVHTRTYCKKAFTGKTHAATTRGKGDGAGPSPHTYGAYTVLGGHAKLKAIDRALEMLSRIVEFAELDEINTEENDEKLPLLQRFIDLLPEDKDKRKQIMSLEKLRRVLRAEKYRLLQVKKQREKRGKQFVWPRWGNPRPERQKVGEMKLLADEVDFKVSLGLILPTGMPLQRNVSETGSLVELRATNLARREERFRKMGLHGIGIPCLANRTTADEAAKELDEKRIRWNTHKHCAVPLPPGAQLTKEFTIFSGWNSDPQKVYGFGPTQDTEAQKELEQQYQLLWYEPAAVDASEEVKVMCFDEDGLDKGDFLDEATTGDLVCREGVDYKNLSDPTGSNPPIHGIHISTTVETEDSIRDPITETEGHANFSFFQGIHSLIPNLPTLPSSQTPSPTPSPSLKRKRAPHTIFYFPHTTNSPPTHDLFTQPLTPPSSQPTHSLPFNHAPTTPSHPITSARSEAADPKQAANTNNSFSLASLEARLRTALMAYGEEMQQECVSVEGPGEAGDMSPTDRDEGYCDSCEDGELGVEEGAGVGHDGEGERCGLGGVARAA